MFTRNGTYWTRVYDVMGGVRRVSLETTQEAAAAKVDNWLKSVRDRLDPYQILPAIVAGDLTPVQAFVLGEQRAAQYLKDLAADAADRELTDADITAWQRELQRQKLAPKSIAYYKACLDRAWPAPRRVSWLEPRTISKALKALTCGEATKGQHRAAVASFVAYLLEAEVIATNPMPSVVTFAQSEVRKLWYSREDARRVIMATPMPYRGVTALMYACGWELSACRNALAGDLDLDALTAHARGTKTDTRDRLTVILDPWVLPILKDVKAGKLPTAKLWPQLDEKALRQAHQDACVACEVPVTTLHDWRHTFAVNALKEGRSQEFTAQMLGHSNTAMVRQRYGRYHLSAGEVKMVAAEVSQQVAQKRDTA